MRGKIAALIIDPHKADHDYNLDVRNDFRFRGVEYVEQGFEISVITSTERILTEINKFRSLDAIITVGNDLNFVPMNALSYEFRKHWAHVEEYDKDEIVSLILTVFMNNIYRERDGFDRLFSVFTCTYKTTPEMFNRLYESLKRQTYPNWNWYILDDSPGQTIAIKAQKLHDPRIVVVSNITNHGVIGFNKHACAMMCDGEFLVEVDHDDELVPDCFEQILYASDAYPDAGFFYSNCLEMSGDVPIRYGEGWGYGFGMEGDVVVNGIRYESIPITPPVNAVTIRGIHAAPNHVRCWKRELYHKIGGHNRQLSVIDDLDLLIRTFIGGRMCKISKVLYIQHEGVGTDESRGGNSTQTKRYREIQRTNILVSWKYDKKIHARIEELGVEDKIWNPDIGYSHLFTSEEAYDEAVKDGLEELNYTYIPE